MIRFLIAALLVVLGESSASAAPGGPAEKSLDKCQNTMRLEGVKYVQGTHRAIATCLGKVSDEVVKKNAPSVGAALRPCTAEFDRIGRADGRSLASQFAEKVGAKCAPSPANAHRLDDLLGNGSPSVAEPLGVADLNATCAALGGDGSVDSAAEWLACVRSAQDCAVFSAIATEFPRALEWLNQLAIAMPPSSARSAVVAVERAIDGASDDDVPDLQCVSTCGDGLRTATEQCDGNDLAGATCESLGFALGSLSCDATTCSFDLTSCSTGSTGVGFPATGQTTCWGGYFIGPVPCTGTAQDGEIRAGAPLAYRDNGDGTISDLNTGLMWEKKSDDDSLNDKDRWYAFRGRCSGDCTTPCGTDAECARSAGGVCGSFEVNCPNSVRHWTAFQWIEELNRTRFAGHDDWRMPNARELSSLVNFEMTAPAISAEFNRNCGARSGGNPGCTVLTCSCTATEYPHWTSSTYARDPEGIWQVSFLDGLVSAFLSQPTGGAPTRAVRGGQ